MTITHPHHPLRGQHVALVQVRQGADPDLIVRLPDGTHAALAMSSTDYAGAPADMPPQDPAPLLALEGLRQVVRLVECCRQRARARDLGWPREHITIIDQDQGHSGASTAGRDGFQSLIVEVGLGHAGAVLSLEVSRLARSSSDWYRLLEICALTDTLVIDEEGVYAPGQYNDRLLLGFKGTMSEAELHWLRSRLLGGKLEKAHHGTLRFRPPAGFVFDPAGQVVLDPDMDTHVMARDIRP